MVPDNYPEYLRLTLRGAAEQTRTSAAVQKRATPDDRQQLCDASPSLLFRIGSHD